MFPGGDDFSAAPLTSYGTLAVERTRLLLRVQSIAWETEGIRVYELRDPNGRELPGFTPGAHIELGVPGGWKRSFSLINLPEDRRRYVIAVYREPNGRGGSKALHEKVRIGDLIETDSPINNFPTVDGAGPFVFIAGGIGITPFLPMLERVARAGHRLDLYYSVRTRGAVAFMERLSLHGDRLHLVVTREPGGHRLNIADVVMHAPLGAQLYCCGPKSMLDDFNAAIFDRDPTCVHVEYFAPVEPAATTGGFLVELARTGRSIAVPPGKTILQTLLDEGLDIPCSCLEGVCGTCETRVIDGVPDHRDAVLTKQERQAGKTMMICCSGAKSEKLVLDI
jgi:vanillate O-demethylase ferredoxin subunit